MTIIMVACALTYIAFCRRGNFEPGSLLWGALLRYVPRFGEFCWRVQPLVFYPMVVLHAGEAGYMVLSRLERHSVRWGSGVWWMWVGSAFLEGWGSFVRFDEGVRKYKDVIGRIDSILVRWVSLSLSDSLRRELISLEVIRLG